MAVTDGVELPPIPPSPGRSIESRRWTRSTDGVEVDRQVVQDSLDTHRLYFSLQNILLEMVRVRVGIEELINKDLVAEVPSLADSTNPREYEFMTEETA